MTKKEVHVTIDVREPADVTDAVSQHDEVSGYSLETLEAADLSIEDVGFERKTMSDYASSLTDGRIEEQRRKLGEEYEKAYILVDGDLVETTSLHQSQLSGTSLRGSMASLTARNASGVDGVIPCSNTGLLVDMAVRIARKTVETSDDVYVPDANGASTTVQMFSCIEGVGAKTAEKLAEEFPTMSHLMGTPAKDLMLVDDVGEKTAANILDALYAGDYGGGE